MTSLFRRGAAAALISLTAADLAAAQAVGADFRYTEYPDGNHNAWDATYSDPAMWAWLFAQRR